MIYRVHEVVGEQATKKDPAKKIYDVVVDSGPNTKKELLHVHSDNGCGEKGKYIAVNQANDGDLYFFQRVLDLK